ncbi:MAG: hypothetical protein IPK07_35555 [Deltaproteobacteria bacterium]|nr:hypothetical protein [Deltaproteobacteria bacterium]
MLLDVIRPSTPEAAEGWVRCSISTSPRPAASGTWPIATMQAWHRDAGLSVEAPIPLRTPPNAAMVVGRRPRA